MGRAAHALALTLACCPACLPAQGVSPSGAAAWSGWGTLLPVGAGVALMAAAGNGPDPSASLTGAGVLLFTGGIAVGPSLGYFAIGRPRRAWTGVGLRVLGFGAAMGAIGASSNCDGAECGPGMVVFLAGSALMLGSVIYDIATVKDAARRQLEGARGTAVSVLPTYSISRHAAGLLVRLRF